MENDYRWTGAALSGRLMIAMYKEPSLLTLITARGGSKRIVGKNIRPLGKYSLLAWTVAIARAAGLGDTMLLSTDDPDILAEGKTLELPAPFVRPAALAGDAVTTVAVALHALDWLREMENWTPDLLVLLQPTSPFRAADTVVDGIARMEDNLDADALISVTPLHVASNSIFAERDGFLHGLAGKRDSGRCAVPSGALYIIRPDALREHESFVPPRTISLEHSGLSALDIDTLDDWAMAEAAVAAGLVTFPSLNAEKMERKAGA